MPTPHGSRPCVAITVQRVGAKDGVFGRLIALDQACNALISEQKKLAALQKLLHGAMSLTKLQKEARGGPSWVSYRPPSDCIKPIPVLEQKWIQGIEKTVEYWSSGKRKVKRRNVENEKRQMLMHIEDPSAQDQQHHSHCLQVVWMTSVLPYVYITVPRSVEMSHHSSSTAWQNYKRSRHQPQRAGKALVVNQSVLYVIQRPQILQTAANSDQLSEDHSTECPSSTVQQAGKRMPESYTAEHQAAWGSWKELFEKKDNCPRRKEVVVMMRLRRPAHWQVFYQGLCSSFVSQERNRGSRHPRQCNS